MKFTLCKRPSLAKAFHKLLALQFYVCGFLKLAQDILLFVGTMGILAILKAIRTFSASKNY
jgi:hypothetical protein